MRTYHGEKAIISLTSWKARIDTVSKTLFSLIKQCPGFHIVLVLSEEEFPKKEAELPTSLMAFVNNNLIELLWVYKNYKSLKKVIPTMKIYNSVPIISADDDCIYTCNYAEQLYQASLKTPNIPIMYRKSRFPFCLCGPASLYPPVFFDGLVKKFDCMDHAIQQDDGFIMEFFKELNVQGIAISNKFPCYFHDEINALTGSRNVPEWQRDQSF